MNKNHEVGTKISYRRTNTEAELEQWVLDNDVTLPVDEV